MSIRGRVRKTMSPAALKRRRVSPEELRAIAIASDEKAIRDVTEAIVDIRNRNTVSFGDAFESEDTEPVVDGKSAD